MSAETAAGSAISSESSLPWTSDNPFLRGQYTPVFDQRDDDRLVVHGRLPEGLAGVFMRNGPNQQFPPLGRYHVFDGDGMIHAVELDGDGGARYRNRWVESKGLLAERDAGKSLFGGLSGFQMPEPDVLAKVGMMKNTANTHIVRHAGKILALMEAAPPTEIRSDLTTVGEYTFDGSLHGPMTAHPRFDPTTGEMLFFGYLPFPPFLRFHIANADGVLTTSVDIELPRGVMMHDFVITDRHVVFFDLPAIFDVESMFAGGPIIRWDPSAGARIGVLDRQNLTAGCSWTEVDPFYAFHFANAWEDGDSISVVGCRAPEMPTSFGDEPAPEVRPSLTHWRIPLDGGDVLTTQLDDRAADFPRINDDRSGLRSRFGYLAASDGWSPDGVEFSKVIAYDLESKTSVEHRYGDGFACGEPVFAADPNGTAENDGWILNFVTELASERTSLVVVDARDLGGEPVAVVDIPRRVPFGFHGNWMPASR